MKAPQKPECSERQMQLRYDEDLVEAAVLLCTAAQHRGVPALQIARFHRQREKLYSILDPEERNSAFFQFHLDWFCEWGLAKSLTDPVKEFALLQKSLSFLVIRKSRNKGEDGTELYVNEAGERTGILALRPEFLVARVNVDTFLRHELMHLHDMVDPAFGYQPELSVSGPSLSQSRLARERYRLLWDVSIDGRLNPGGGTIIATKEQRWTEFTNAFSFWSEGRQKEVFESLWTNPSPSHELLAGLVTDPRQLQATTRPGPGAPCPLCGFPTFVWATPDSLVEPTLSAIHSEFPNWTPEQGACARCCSIYRVNRTQLAAVL